MHIKSVYSCCCCCCCCYYSLLLSLLFVAFFSFFYFLLLFPYTPLRIYTLQAYRYRRVKKIVVHQLFFIINFRPTASLEHWFGSPRNNYGSRLLCESWDSRNSRGTSTREKIVLA